MDNTTIKIIFSFIGGFLGYFLGGFDTMLVCLLIFMIVDYFTGIINAILDKTMNSKVGSKGIAKKVYILLLIGSVNLLGNAMGMDELRYVVISFYLANEGLSIIENASKIGVPVPKQVKNVLEQIKDEHEMDEELSNGKGDDQIV